MAILKGQFLFDFGDVSLEEKNETIKKVFRIIGTEKEFNENEFLGK